MFRRVLIAVDGSEHAYAALRRAAEVLKLSPLTHVAVVEVVPPVDPSIEYVPWVSPAQLEEAERKRAKADLEKALAILQEAGLEGTAVIKCRRHQADQGGHADHRGYQPGFGRDGVRRIISGGPLLPLERDHHPGAAVTEAERRHRTSGNPLYSAGGGEAE